MKKIDDSKALREVWSWKDSAYGEVKGLPIKAAVHERLKRSIEIATSLKRDKAFTARCAEDRETYGEKYEEG